jgi:hypothetical protein
VGLPRTFLKNGVQYVRVTVRFVAGGWALAARAFVHDVLIHTHGFRIARRLNRAVAASGGRFQVMIARRHQRWVTRQLRVLDDAGVIVAFVNGRRV